MTSTNRNKKGSAIFASGGDQYQPANIAKPRRTIAEIRKMIRDLGPRPSHTDIPALTEWVQRKQELTTMLVLHGVAA